MPIGPKILKRYGKRHIILTHNHTLSDAITILEQKRYEPNQTYLVVKCKNDAYLVALYSDLGKVIGLMGDNVFDTLLPYLPIPEAQRIVLANTPESSGDVMGWVTFHSQSTVVVVDGQECVGVFANPDRSEIVEGLSFLSCHGELAKLHQEHRLGIKSNISPPLCPACKQQHFFEYDVEKKAYYCPEKKVKIKQL